MTRRALQFHGGILVTLAVMGLATVTGCSSQPPELPPDQQLGVSQSAAEEAAPSPDDVLAGHRRMVKELAAISTEAYENHPFVGQRGLKDAQRELDTYGADAPPLERSRMHGMLGQELLRVGKTSDAIDHTLEAVRLLDEHREQVAAEIREQAYYLLAIAYLRDGEDRNCVHCINGERCLFPIRGLGIHEQPQSSQQAVKYLTQVLEMNPDHIGARWLLNIAHMTLGQYPDQVPEPHRIPPEQFASDPSPIGEFRNVARDLGLNVLGCAGGVIADDFDGDWDLDLVFSSWAPDGQLRYFRNNGNGSFTEQTEEANLTGITGGLNLVHADYDNDGDLDVLVLRGGWLEHYGRYPNSLLRNDGQARFVDVTFVAGLGEEHFPTQTAGWADYDVDGDLDLYIGNEGFPSQLFRNNGRGKFEEVTQKAGVANHSLAKGVAWGDYNDDSLPDIYVSNFPGANRLYRNNGNGTFSDVAQEAGVTGPYRSFPTWFWDFNNDGVLDLFVASFQAGLNDVAADYTGMPTEGEPDAVYQGTKEGKFKDVAAELGYTRVTQPMGVNFGDIDNDGFLDFYLGTGYVDYEGLIPNLMFHNDKGQKFRDITFSARVGHLQKGHGIAFADLDQDGDEDIVAVMGGWFAGDAFAKVLFENPGNEAHWLNIRLVGEQSNRFGIGCRVRATVGGDTPRNIYRWLGPGGSFGASPLRIHLGLGADEQVDELEVYWPTSKIRQVFRGIAAGQFVQITEGEDEYVALPHEPVKFQAAAAQPVISLDEEHLP